MTALVGFGLAMLALWIWQGGQSAAFLLIVSAVWLASALGTRMLLLREVEAESRLEVSRLYAGDRAQVTLRIRHRSYWPVIWLVVKETWLHSSGTSMELRQLIVPWFRTVVKVTYTLRDLQRGEYRSGGVELFSGDLFGLVQVRRSRKGQASFVVYPKPLEVNESLHGGTDDDNRVGRHKEYWRESAILRSVRPYESGDPMHRIHWKLTARTGALKTKTFEPASSNRVRVCLDVSSDSYKGRDGLRLFETAARAAAGIARESQQAGGGWAHLMSSSNADAGIVVASADEIRSAYEWLARLRPNGNERFADYLLREALRLPARQTLICITPVSGVSLLPVLHRLRSGGHGCTVILVHSGAALSMPHRQWARELQHIGCGFAEVQAGAAPAPSICAEGGAVDGIA
jgi:uncharacterized protein (DUF58 family)